MKVAVVVVAVITAVAGVCVVVKVMIDVLTAAIMMVMATNKTRAGFQEKKKGIERVNFIHEVSVRIP